MKPFTRAHGRKAVRVTRQAWRQRLTARQRPLPSFIVIGAQKCGTTSLHDYLAQHPAIASSRIKEVQYFDVPERYANGEEWYRAQFPLPTPRDPRMAFESTPNYLFHRDVPARIARLLPDVRLIAVLRHPGERAVSGYRHEVRRGREPLPLRDALLAEADRVAPALAAADYDSPVLRNCSYLGRGRYAEQLERYYALFPRDKVLVVRSEDLFAHPEVVIAEITDFLGLPPMPETVRFPRLNAATPHGPGSAIPPEVSDVLSEHFDPHNARLEQMLGRSFDWG
jgi:hypothetical protein